MLSDYDINLKDMSEDSAEYEYTLDDAFFSELEDVSIRRGTVRARVLVHKLAQRFSLELNVDGEVYVPCDRCLEDMSQPVSGSNSLLVKFGERYLDEGDELIIVEEDKGILNVAWFLYEIIALAVPIYHAHEEGGCDPGMQEILSTMLREQGQDEELSKSQEASDPRWDGLKKLLNNN